MEFIEEIVVDEFLPTVRAMLAERLRDRGLTQREVGELLGVSQSAVSKYAHGEVAINERVRENERVQETVESVADGLADGDLSAAGALVELEVLVRELEAGGLLAKLHKERMPALERHDVVHLHDPESAIRARERTLADLRRGITALERTSGVASLLPNVGANLVHSLPDAETIEDVAGIPGRIFDVKGQATVPADPEFGVSGHVAQVLLAAREAGNEARAAINLAYDEDLLGALTAQGHTAVQFDPEDDVAAAVERAVAAEPEATVIYQTGGFGVEPVLYYLDENPTAVVHTIRELV